LCDVVGAKRNLNKGCYDIEKYKRLLSEGPDPEGGGMPSKSCAG